MAKNRDAVTSELIVSSIGLCPAYEDNKKKACVIAAYNAGNGGVTFIALPFPTKKVYSREDVLSAIAQAEGVGAVRYDSVGGGQKDIIVCRADSGKVTDIVPRDIKNDRFIDGFSEVVQTAVKFKVGADERALRLNESMNVEIAPSGEYPRERGTYAYAFANAYNACLLGGVFEREELRIVTKRGKRAKFCVRDVSGEFIDEEVLYVKPVSRDTEGTVDFYVTEEFNYIDGENSSRRSYKIIFSGRLNNYNLIRQ